LCIYSRASILGVVLLSLYTDLQGFSLIMFWVSIGLLAGSVIWSWIDAFFLNKRIENFNQTVEQEIIHRIKNEINL